MQIGRLLRRHVDAHPGDGLAVGYTVELLRWPYPLPGLTDPAGRHRVHGAGAATALTSHRLRDRHRAERRGHGPCGSRASTATPSSSPPCFIFNLYSLGAHARGVEAWLGGVGVVATIVMAAVSDGDLSPSGVFFYTVLCGLPWGAGVVVRLRVDRVAELAAAMRSSRTGPNARWPTSAPGSPVSCTTSCPTPSPSRCCRPRGGRRMVGRGRGGGTTGLVGHRADEHLGPRGHAPAAVVAARCGRGGSPRRARAVAGPTLHARGPGARVGGSGRAGDQRRATPDAAGSRPVGLPHRAGSTDQRAQARRPRRPGARCTSATARTTSSWR